MLAKQEELRQNQLDITILQVTEETKLKNLLEDSAELLDPNLAAANERAELVAKEEEALRKINGEIAGITQYSETYKQNAEASAEGSKDQQYWLDLIAKDQEKLNELLPQQELLQGAINKKLEDYEQKKRDSQKKGKEILEEEKLDVDQYFDDLLDAEEDYFADSMDFALDDFRKEQELEEQRRANFQASHDESMRLLDEAQAKKDEALQADEDAEKRRRELISMTNDMRLRLASQSFQAIEALGKAFASQDEKDAEKKFQSAKGFEPCECYGISDRRSYKRIQNSARKSYNTLKSCVSRYSSGACRSLWSRTSRNDSEVKIQSTRQSKNPVRRVVEGEDLHQHQQPHNSTSAS